MLRAVFAVTLVATVPQIAWADVAAAASAQAAELFEQGRALVAKEDFRAACPKFDDSNRLEPKVGTLLNLAACEEHLGQLVAARGHWQDAASLARAVHDERATVAMQRFAALDPRVAKLSVLVRGPYPDDLRVTRDGVRLGSGSLGTPLPVDPGRHVIVVTLGARDDRSYSVELTEGETKVLEVEPGAQRSARPSSFGGRKVAAAATAGVGVAGVVAGAVLGLVASSEYSKSGCHDGVCASPSGPSESATAYHEGVASTVAFVVGGVGLATGAILWLTAGHSPEKSDGPRAAVVLGPTSLRFCAQF